MKCAISARKSPDGVAAMAYIDYDILYHGVSGDSTLIDIAVYIVLVVLLDTQVTFGDRE